MNPVWIRAVLGAFAAIVCAQDSNFVPAKTKMLGTIQGYTRGLTAKSTKETSQAWKMPEDKPSAFVIFRNERQPSGPLGVYTRSVSM